MSKRWRRDAALIAVLLAAAACLWLFARPQGAGAVAVVTLDGAEIARYPLVEEMTIRLGGEGYNVLRIENGAAAVVEANCGDHTCLRMGAISQAGESIICLPHHLVITIEGGQSSSVDAVTR